jgi:TolB-like protein/class 3 adenylate cyclase
MAEERVQRKLAAILAADVVGYSRLMGEDETGTLTALKGLRSELIDPIIAEHKGRIVKLMGDGALVEFASVVDAVECAVSIQRNMVGRTADIPDSKRITFRIGVNVGDVIIDGDDIYGDGINVAARLEGIADPGGVCISGTVFDQIRNKVDLSFEDLGPQEVKNIAEPIRAYRVQMNSKHPMTAPPGETQRSRWGLVGGGVAIAAVLVASGLYAWLGERVSDPQGTATLSNPADTATVKSRDEQAVPVPTKPSIAVLAFDNLSGDPEQEYFADGMAEDIITGLSKLSALFVVARNSSFQYKNQTVDAKQVGRELGVHYLLEGSVQRAGNQVRINAKLIDTRTGGNLWAERYDGQLDDVFALQDKVTGQIVGALSLNLNAEDKAQLADHGTTNIEAHDAFLRGRSFAANLTAEGAKQAILHYQRALELDPNYKRAADALKQIRFIEKFSGFK